MIDCIAGYHLNPWTCGIAKFNAILAKHLDVEVVGIRAVELGSLRAAAAVGEAVRVQRPRRRRPRPVGVGAPGPVRAVPARVRRDARSSSGWWPSAARVYVRQRRAVPRAAPPAAGRPGAVLPGHDPQPAAVHADRALGVHLRHGAQDPRAALPAAARAARGDRADLLGVRVDGAAREHQLRRLVRGDVRGAAVDLQRAGLLHGLPVRHGGVQPPARQHVSRRLLREGAAGQQHHGERRDGVRLRGDHQPRRAFAGRA